MSTNPVHRGEEEEQQGEEKGADPNVETLQHHHPPPQLSSGGTDTTPSNDNDKYGEQMERRKKSVENGPSPKRGAATTKKGIIPIPMVHGGSLSSLFGSRLTPLLPSSFAGSSKGIQRSSTAPITTAAATSMLSTSSLDTSYDVGRSMTAVANWPERKKRKGHTVASLHHDNTFKKDGTASSSFTTATKTTNDTDHQHHQHSIRRTVAPTTVVPLRAQLIAAMMRTGTTWECLAGEYQRAVSGYARLGVGAIRQWAENKGEDVTVGSERGVCEALASAFIEDSASFSKLVAEHFQSVSEEEGNIDNGDDDGSAPKESFMEFCHRVGIPLGDTAAWINGGPSGSSVRLNRALSPQALSLLTHTAIARRSNMHRDEHHNHKAKELVRRGKDRSKMAASPEMLREFNSSHQANLHPKDILLLELGASHSNLSPPVCTTAASLRTHAQPHQHTCLAAPRAFKVIQQYKGRFGRSESAPMLGLVMETSSAGTDVGSEGGGHRVGDGSTRMVTAGVEGGSPLTSMDDGATSPPLPSIVPTWRRMASIRPPVPIRPDSHPLRQSRDTQALSASSPAAVKIRVTQESRPGWYQDRQELEAVMRRRILSSTRNRQNDELVEAFFEPVGSHRGVVRGGGFPIVGIVAESIVNEQRKRRSEAVYNQEFGGGP